MKHIIGLTALLLIISCQEKTPDAYFELPEIEYKPEQEISIKNQTMHGYSFKWEILNSNTYSREEFSSEDLTFIPATNGSYEISLTAYSKNKTKSDYLKRFIVVDGGQGQTVFYTNSYNSCGYLYITITPGNIQGTIDPYYYYTLPPQCSSLGNFTTTLDAGNYSYTASYGSTNNCKSWSGDFTVTKDDCLPILLLQ